MRGAAAIGGSPLPERFGGQRLPAVEAIDLARERPPPGRFIAPRARRRGADCDRARRAGAVFPQPPRLCAADALPRLRLSFRLPELRRLAGRSPLPPAARLPSLRLRHAAPGRVPEMPGDEFFVAIGPGVERLEEEVRELFPQARRAGALERSRRHGRAAARRTRRRGRTAASTSSSARSSSPRAITFRSSIWSASSMPISA